MNFKRFIGNKAFYTMMLGIAVPIMVQNGVTNLVNLLDNIMVGRLGTEAMSAVSIVNQFIFVFNLLVFGATSAAGIFTAQLYGNGDYKGVRDTFRIKFLICGVSSVVAVVLFALLDDTLIGMFLHESESECDLELALSLGKEYLSVILIGLIPYSLSNVYMSTLRETGNTVPPMIASIVAVVVNFIFNLLLIFGFCGFPALGVKGAAIATVLSRFAELGVLVVTAHCNKEKYPWITGAYKSLKVPSVLMGKIAVKGLPLVFNETFWALGMTMRNQLYSTRGLDVVAGQNITSTVVNLFSVVYLAMGAAIGVILGNLLGAGKVEEAKDADNKMLAFSIMSSAVMGIILAAFSPLFPKLYNTTDIARDTACFMMIVSAVLMPFFSFANATYFTIRSGGRVWITLLFDSVFVWVAVLPITAVFAYFTQINIAWLYIIGQGAEALKGIAGYLLVRRGTWAVSLTE